jgi:hypothetical protein
LNFIPEAGLSTLKLIRSYFNLYNFKLERKIRKTRLLRRFKRLSSHKIYVSNGEFKHTNDKVIITVYLFNRQRHNYILKMNKIYLKKFTVYKKRLNNRFKLIKHKALNYFNEANKRKYILIKALNPNNILNKKSVNIYKSLYCNYYISELYKKFVKKSLKKLKIYLYYKQLIYINKSKFNYTYLENLKNYVEKIYNKNVEFNLVNLKYFYLNSDILSESITLKIQKNRSKLLKFLNILIRKVKIQKQNFIFNPNLNKRKLNLEQIINKDKTNIEKEKYLKHNVFKDIKYKLVSGLRLEAKGRLTRRYTASRSKSKLIYKGNLINIDSSYYGLSSVLLKGNLRSNLQYTKLNSKTRIGSFGIKG